MKTHTFSIVVGTEACNARCPFCVSKMTATDFPSSTGINRSRFKTACGVAQMARDGLLTVLLTGKGEPTLFPAQIKDYLNALGPYNFPLIDLQTNGILFDPRIDGNLRGELRDWRDRGLTLVCLSVAHYIPEKSNELMGISSCYDFRRAIEAIHKLGLAVRLNYTMLRSGIYGPKHMADCATLAEHCGVEQLTFREVTRPDDPICPEVAEYVDRERPVGACKQLFHYLEMNGAHRLPDLAHGAALFDWAGQNISINHCLTDTLDSNDIRQIIFFPGGEICYDWKYRGARIL